jgi:hypothetical protein
MIPKGRKRLLERRNFKHKWYTNHRYVIKNKIQ